MRHVMFIAAWALVGCGLSAEEAGPTVRGVAGALAAPCSISAGVVAVSLNPNESATVGLSDAGVLLVNGVACSTATALSVTRINIGAANLQLVSDETVTLDVSRGLFALGTVSTPGIFISLGAGTGDVVQVAGSEGVDFVLAGHGASDEWLTLNYDRFKDVSMTGVEALTLTGAGGNDVLNGSSTNPAWDAGTYFTTSAATTLVLTLNGDDGADVLTGGAANDQLLGGNGDDVLVESAGTDTANGQAGNDTFDEGAATNGNDTLIGGTEVDTVSYAARTTGVVVSVGSGANDGATNERDDVRVDVEVVIGGSARDVMQCHGATGCTLRGGDGNDALTGHDGADTLLGEAGDDSLQPGAGDDVLVGGAGVDLVTYADALAGVTVTLGAAGTPTTGNGVSGENDSLDELENVVGSDFGDTLAGNALANRIVGGLGDDTVDGAAGDDVFDEGSSTNGADTFHGGPGVDRVDYSARTQVLTVTMASGADDGEAAEGDDVGSDVEDLSGGSMADDVTGNALGNRLDGNDGNDTLRGLAGNDELTGGLGQDVLLGGDGDDVLDPGADGASSCVCGLGFDISVCAVSAADCEVR